MDMSACPNERSSSSELSGSPPDPSSQDDSSLSDGSYRLNPWAGGSRLRDRDEEEQRQHPIVFSHCWLVYTMCVAIHRYFELNLTSVCCKFHLLEGSISKCMSLQSGFRWRFWFPKPYCCKILSLKAHVSKGMVLQNLSVEFFFTCMVLQSCLSNVFPHLPGEGC